MIYPTGGHRALFEKHFGATRFVYNRSLFIEIS
ncbi:helix-turn-helix domain-containing protein [Methanolobus halotolerans]|uniref:Transposase putative helix-turn-helix domain-containing protein n=1 Tax=Methanolobus halotolerans TaxID=2052935 RepID=A0A4E0PUF7_9EURY|nr:hypothetical protein CUN85_12510 [Methanolobus halotolerans]